MNLYQLNFTHYAQKGDKSGIRAFILADNDEQIFNYLAQESNPLKTYWYDDTKIIYDSEKEEFINPEDDESDEEYDGWYDENYEPVTFKEWCLVNKGDGQKELHDLYYGQTVYFWELKKENCTEEECDILKELNLLHIAK